MRRTIKPNPRSVATLEAELLKRVRSHGGLSRVELARELHLAPSTAGIYVDRLIKEGFLTETDKAVREQGRPPVLLQPNPQGGRFVGVDFEARNIMAVAVDFSQEPLKRVHKYIKDTDSVAQVLGKIEDAIAEVTEGDPRPVLGIGVGVPGQIINGVAINYEFIRKWKNVPLGEKLKQRFDVPIFLENNIRTMALAELWFGQGRGLQNFICVGVRTGIAAGIIAEGQLYHGSTGAAGEIGKWPVRQISQRPADQHKNLEGVASLSALIKRGSEILQREVTWEELREAIADGNPALQQAVTELAEIHGHVAVQLCGLLNPQRLIFAGPLAELGESFLAPVKTVMHNWQGDVAPDVVCSELGEYNGAIGAAALALHQWRPVR